MLVFQHIDPDIVCFIKVTKYSAPPSEGESILPQTSLWMRPSGSLARSRPVPGKALLWKVHKNQCSSKRHNQNHSPIHLWPGYASFLHLCHKFTLAGLVVEGYPIMVHNSSSTDFLS